MKKARNARKPKAARPFMPGYGILPADQGKGLFPWSWAQERLAKARNYFLSTTWPDGKPHCMPVWGIWLEDTFWFSTGRLSRKARNLTANPQCVVSSDHAKGVVVLEGEAARIQDAKMWKRFAKAYEAKYKFDMSGYSEEPMYVVQPHKIFGLTLELPQTATRWTFDGGIHAAHGSASA